MFLFKTSTVFFLSWFFHFIKLTNYLKNTNKKKLNIEFKYGAEKQTNKNLRIPNFQSMKKIYLQYFIYQVEL